MNQATNAQLERLTMTDGSIAYNVIIWDESAPADSLRIDFATEDGAQSFLDILREQNLIEVSFEMLEVSH